MMNARNKHESGFTKEQENELLELARRAIIRITNIRKIVNMAVEADGKEMGYIKKHITFLDEVELKKMMAVLQPSKNWNK